LCLDSLHDLARKDAGMVNVARRKWARV